jgi:hypothetical protein
MSDRCPVSERSWVEAARGELGHGLYVEGFGRDGQDMSLRPEDPVIVCFLLDFNGAESLARLIPALNDYLPRLSAFRDCRRMMPVRLSHNFGKEAAIIFSEVKGRPLYLVDQVERHGACGKLAQLGEVRTA